MKAAALLLAVLFGLFTTAAAHAAEIPVISTRSVNLRAGPGVNFPVVARLPSGAPLVLHGCVEGYAWCDVSWGAERGWLASAYLGHVYRGAPVALTAAAAARLGIAIVAFDAGYWHRYYLGRPWFPRWRYYHRWW